MGGKRKIPGSLRDAPAASIQKWLEHADDENANCETTNSLDKNSLCTLACFMLGWQPDAPLPGCHSLIWSCSPKKENGIMQRLTETNLGWVTTQRCVLRCSEGELLAALGLNFHHTFPNLVEKS